MVTEKMIVTAVRLLHGRRWTMSRTLNTGAEPVTTESVEEHAMPPGMLLRSLLSQYSLPDADGIIRWLEIGDYVTYTGWGLIAPKQLIALTKKGVNLAQTGELEPSERQLVYREDPYSVFLARQFRDEDVALFKYLRDAVLAPLGLTAIDGSVDGIEAFRGEILRKIALARFFVCILTRRAELRAGGFASSVWLYQEMGAAVALGKKPLVLVESGLDEHYAGELQKNYEYVPFERTIFQDAMKDVGRRIVNDLTANHIPLLQNASA
jgi:hypothetical protein